MLRFGGILFTQIITEKARRLVRRGGFLGIHNGELVLHGEFFAAWRLCAPKTSLTELFYKSAQQRIFFCFTRIEEESPLGPTSPPWRIEK
jgi:hypothetical protein